MSSLNNTIDLKCTPAALKHIRKYLAMQVAPMALRIRLKKSGCSGWLYHFEYSSQAQESEMTCTLDSGLKVFIPREPEGFFQGAIIDYVKSGFSGILTCINPNEGIRCGCGESFTMGDQA